MKCEVIDAKLYTALRGAGFAPNLFIRKLLPRIFCYVTSMQ
uniref:Seminal fluid protein CSSFP047 n=1 Tax=Chilo suppressalis TaxID=168631 RepID=G9F9J9_CHISP|nr:seminal fluid protein CSSFP047 [Chilo suppressalis]